MKRALFALALVASPAAAQDAMDHSGHDMAGSGHDMAGMNHDMAEPDHDMAGMNHDMAGPDHDMAAMDMSQASPGTDDEPGNAAPPPVPTDNIEDRYWDAGRMEAARMHLTHVGHYTTSALLIDELEYRAVNGRDGYGWKAQAWQGDDHDRIALTTEGEGAFGEGVERAEASLLWRHALDPYFNLETGVRHDFRPDPQRTYAVVGIQGLAPYWFELEAQALVSNKGDVHARIGASYDQRITQRLILEPEGEVNIALQDVPELGIASGFERIELGARLRYEIQPGFGPYLGIHWERKLGGSADYARAEGEKPSQVAAVFGLRAWF